MKALDLGVALILCLASPAAAQVACTFALAPAGVSVPARGPNPDGSAHGVITVTASRSDCARTATSNVEWITVSFGSPGTGHGTVGYTVKLNTWPVPRTGTVTVGGQAFTVNQAAANCDFNLTASATQFPPSGGSGTLTVTTTCSWVASSSVAWIGVVSPSATTGNGTAPFIVQPNPAGQERTGVLTAGLRSINVTQAAAPCNVVLAPSSASIGAGAENGSFSVIAPVGCPWSVTSNAAWVAATPSANAVNYSAAANNTPAQRTAVIGAGNAQFTLTQAASSCPFNLSHQTATVPAARGNFSIAVSTTTCEWSAVSNASWITLVSGSAGSGTGLITYSVADNPAGERRTGTITIAGREFTVIQQAAPCQFVLIPPSLVVPASGGSGVIQVAGPQGCAWTLNSPVPWVSIVSWTTTATGGSVSYSAAANPGPGPRSGVLTIAGQAFLMNQEEPGPRITAGGVTNGASFRAGPVAPGEIITIFGAIIGPPQLTTLQLTSDGKRLTNTLANTRVFFDGLAAPLIYVSESQTSAIVPYAVEDRRTVQMQVEYAGRRSNPVTLDVASTAPGVFTLNSSGSGAGAVLNQDYSVNSAAAPAERGSVVMIFATGEGQTVPPGEDGKLADTLANPREPVAVVIGGLPAEVEYAGSAPGNVAGLLQVNARIPTPVQPGPAVPLAVVMGGRSSQPGVTIAVR